MTEKRAAHGPHRAGRTKTEPEWADRATAQEGAARTDATGRGNGAGWTFWVITEQ